MASGSQNMTTYLAKGLQKVLTISATNTDNLLYINTADTNITADILGTSNSIAFTRMNTTGAYTTGHIVWLNAAAIGTPFQLAIHDGSSLYFYKRYKNNGTWSAWARMKAGTADTWTTARTLTVGGTGKSVDGSENVSWSMNEIMGSSDSTKFYRGDKTWSSTLTGVLTLYREDTTANNNPAGIYFTNKDTTTNQSAGSYIYVYNDHAASTAGNNMIIYPAGTLILGGGEGPGGLYTAIKSTIGTSENCFIVSDGTTYVYSNSQTVANRIGFAVSTAGHILPQKAEAANNNAQNLGASNNKWANVYATTFTGNVTGNVTGNLTGNVTGNCSGSSGSCIGNAATATKLGTATVGGSNQPIYLNAGTATAVSWYHNVCSITGGNQANYPWHRFATCTTGTGQWTDKSVIVIIHGRFDGGQYGMVKLSMRTNATNGAKSTSAVWIYRRGFAVDDIKISAPTKTTGTDETISAYIKCSTYPRRIAYILEGSNVGWSLVSSNEPNDTTSSDKKGGTEINASVSGTTAAVDGGTVNYANTAGTANNVAWANTNHPSSFTPASHTHGNITNAGGITTAITIANGDYIIIGDTSDSGKLGKGPAFDASTATKCLTQKGTWESFNNYSHPTTAGNKHIPSGGSSGQFLGWDSAGTAKWVNNPNTNTTYTFATGGTNGTFKYTPSDGSATEVAIKGLGTAAYTASTAYRASTAPVSGDWFKGTPQIGSNGVMEVGRYIDFHTTAASTADYDFRLDNSAAGTLNFSGHVVLAASKHYYMNYNSANHAVVYNHNNGNVSLNAAGTALYIGYYKTSTIYFHTGGSGSTAGTERGRVDSSGIKGAVWNDFAEFRKSHYKEPGRVVIDLGNGWMDLCNERLAPGAKIISDTYGISVGYSLEQDTPIGVGGRVLVYPYQDKFNYHVGDCVCSAPDGTVDIMTREEIIYYPERILGTVSEIPDYEVWSQQATKESQAVEVEVKGRIWIYVK